MKIANEPKPYARVAWALRKARQAKGFTPWDMAKKIGVDWATYSYIDKGLSLPSDEQWVKINRVLFGD